MNDIKRVVGVLLLCALALVVARVVPGRRDNITITLPWGSSPQVPQSVQPAPSAQQPPQVQQVSPIQIEAGSKEAWAIDFLNAVGNHEPTLEIFAAVVAWQDAEGTSAAFNPLATSQDMPGATSFNGDGVKNYPDYETGIVATVKTLTYDYPGYAELGNGLLTNDPQLIYLGLSAGSWGTNSDNFVVRYNERITQYASLYGIQPAAPEPAQQQQPGATVAPSAGFEGKKCPYTQTNDFQSGFWTGGGDAWAGQYGGFHLGVDFTGTAGDPVYAPYDMHIESTGFYGDDNRFGHNIQARFLHDNTLYYAGHLIDVYVQDGQDVPACAVIGTLGATSFPHVHIKLGGPNAPVPCEGSPPGWETGCIDPVEYWDTH